MMSDIADVTGVTGYSAHGLDDFNKQKVFLGPLPPEPTFVEEAEQVLKVKDTQLNNMDPQVKCSLFDKLLLIRSRQPIYKHFMTLCSSYCSHWEMMTYQHYSRI